MKDKPSTHNLIKERDRQVTELRTHVTGLQRSLAKLREDIEAAERRERDITRDRDHWKDRALAAEAASKSLRALA